MHAQASGCYGALWERAPGESFQPLRRHQAVTEGCKQTRLPSRGEASAGSLARLASTALAWQHHCGLRREV